MENFIFLCSDRNATVKTILITADRKDHNRYQNNETEAFMYW